MEKPPINFEWLEHTADIKFKTQAATINGIFENAALALANYLNRGEKTHAKRSKTIDVSGEDYESLLYNFLDDLIFLFDAEQFITTKANVTMRGFNLHAELFGDDTKNYKNLDHVKAATYSEMYVKKTKNGWEAQVVLDV